MPTLRAPVFLLRKNSPPASCRSIFRRQVWRHQTEFCTFLLSELHLPVPPLPARACWILSAWRSFPKEWKTGLSLKDWKDSDSFAGAQIRPQTSLDYWISSSGTRLFIMIHQLKGRKWGDGWGEHKIMGIPYAIGYWKKILNNWLWEELLEPWLIRKKIFTKTPRRKKKSYIISFNWTRRKGIFHWRFYHP